MPIISIIVPVFNAEKYLKRCINSILTQTFNNFELILVNDGSTDKSGSICDEYSKMDYRIKVIHKANGGPSEARNMGIDNAIGQYIGFVDSDDYIENDMYEKLYEACILYRTRISMCGRYDLLGGTKKTLFSFEGYKVWSSKDAIGNLLTWNNIDSSPCDKLFEKSLFNGIRFPIGKAFEDIFIIYQLLYKAHTISHIGDPKYYYCHRADSGSVQELSEKRLEILEASLEILDFIKKHYQHLLPEAKSFYYKNILFLFCLPQPKSKKLQNKYLYRKLSTLLLNNFPDIILSKYLSRREKIISMLLVTNMFFCIKKINRSLKYFSIKILL